MKQQNNRREKSILGRSLRSVAMLLLAVLLCLGFGTVPVTASAKEAAARTGTIRFGNSFYSGELKGEHPCGEGEFYYMEGKNVMALSGEWTFGDACMNYAYGMWEGESCAQYRGMFLHGVACGYGALIFDDGGLYYGIFVDGVPHGEGVYEYADGTEITGSFTWADRSARYLHSSRAGGKMYYTGMMKAGKPCGYGMLEFDEGGSFYGEFSDGTVEGSGVYVYSTLSNGKYNSFSGEKWTMVYGQTSVNFPGNEYYGLVHNGSWQGYGLSIMSNKNHYVGEVWYNLRSGYGREFNAKNSLYREGMYSNGNFVK